MANIFTLPAELPTEELCEHLISNEGVIIERYISPAQITPGEWYEREEDEWVLLLQGTAKFGYSDGSCIELKAGDYLIIPAYQKHRLEYTSTDPVCIWLVVHAKLL